MNAPYRVLARVFGTQRAVAAIHRTLLEFEIKYPSATFSVKQLAFQGGLDRPHGLEVYGEAFRHLPGFALEQDFYALSGGNRSATLEWIIDTLGGQTYEVAQNGAQLFKADRRADTPHAYDLGESGLKYIYSNQVGMQSVFLDELQHAGLPDHGLHPI